MLLSGCMIKLYFTECLKLHPFTLNLKGNRGGESKLTVTFYEYLDTCPQSADRMVSSFMDSSAQHREKGYLYMYLLEDGDRGCIWVDQI